VDTPEPSALTTPEPEEVDTPEPSVLTTPEPSTMVTLEKKITTTNGEISPRKAKVKKAIQLVEILKVCAPKDKQHSARRAVDELMTILEDLLQDD
jgi:hypothetical protein